MEVIFNDTGEVDFFSEIDFRSAVALGNFDGVHIGHIELIRALERYKKANAGVKTCIWTFSDHSLNILKSRFYVPYITTLDEKIELFSKYDIDYVIFNDFNMVRNMEAEDFTDNVLIRSLKCSMAVCGFNFRFGRNARGNADFLKWCLSEKEVNCEIVEPVVSENEIVSSSLIRSLIKIGDMERVSKFLGRPFSVKFMVVHGKKLGRELGVPTINQNFPDGHIIPAVGIYACTCEIERDSKKKTCGAVSNVGIRPTVGGTFLNLETHIIDFSGDLYDKKIKVNFLRKLRDEKKFSSVEELKDAIQKDIRDTQEYLKRMDIVNKL